MAIIKCPECGSDRSNDSANCPQCGAKSQNKLDWKRKVLALVLGGAVFLWLASGSHDVAPPPESKYASTSSSPIPSREILKISAVDLFKSYERNEVATDEKLNKKTLEIEGTIQSINIDSANNAVIRLETSNELMPVHLSMLGSEITKAASLHAGEQITIRCNHMQRIVGSPVGGDCIFFPANTISPQSIHLQSSDRVLQEKK